MPRFYAQVNFSHTEDDFWTIYHTTTCPVQRRRAQFFALLKQGRTESDVLDITRYSVTAARLLVGRYHDQGLEALKDARHNNPGAARLLTAEEQQQLADQLQQDFQAGIVWDGKKVQAWIKEQWGKEVYLARTYEFMRAAGFSPQKPRPGHIKADLEARENFKTKS